MGKYIDKDELVKELEKRKEELKRKILLVKKQKDTNASKTMHLYIGCYNSILSLLDTLEVKDINIEKESELIANKIMIGVQANKYHTNVYNTKRNDFNHSHLCFAARKGIELGLKAQKGE